MLGRPPKFHEFYLRDPHQLLTVKKKKGKNNPLVLPVYSLDYHNFIIRFESGYSESFIFIFLFFFYKSTYSFLATVGLRCWAQAFSSCGERGLLFVVMHGLLTAVASLVAEHGL